MTRWTPPTSRCSRGTTLCAQAQCVRILPVEMDRPPLPPASAATPLCARRRRTGPPRRRGRRPVGRIRTRRARSRGTSAGRTCVRPPMAIPWVLRGPVIGSTSVNATLVAGPEPPHPLDRVVPVVRGLDVDDVLGDEGDDGVGGRLDAADLDGRALSVVRTSSIVRSCIGVVHDGVVASSRGRRRRPSAATPRDPRAASAAAATRREDGGGASGASLFRGAGVQPAAAPRPWSTERAAACMEVVWSCGDDRLQLRARPRARDRAAAMFHARVLLRRSSLSGRGVFARCDLPAGHRRRGGPGAAPAPRRRDHGSLARYVFERTSTRRRPTRWRSAGAPCSTTRARRRRYLRRSTTTRSPTSPATPSPPDRRQPPRAGILVFVTVRSPPARS